MQDFIYLDHAATTPVRPEVREAMEPYFSSNFANPSSVYRMAQQAKSVVEEARVQIALCLGAQPSEIVFTSGGTESDNAAIKGVALASRSRGKHAVTTAIEHHAVLHPMQELAEHFGVEVTTLPVAASGIVSVADLQAALRPDTVLVSMMWANNEVGTIQPVEEVAALTAAQGIPLHVDAVQAVGALATDVGRVPLDLLSLSAHKFGGPKGVGALYVRRTTRWWPLLTGGGQERNRRAGTENVAGVVGMSRALQLACEERSRTQAQIGALRDDLTREILSRIPDVRINGDPYRRLPNNANFSFPGVHGESLLVGLDLANIMASSGSACASGSLDPSHVLLAMGLSRDLAQSSLRITIGSENTREDIVRAVDVLVHLVARLRGVRTSHRVD